jgi:hypothetical protein
VRPGAFIEGEIVLFQGRIVSKLVREVLKKVHVCEMAEGRGRGARS